VQDFLSASEPYVDPHYADKLWNQGNSLPKKEDRIEFRRKADLFVLWARTRNPKAGPMIHELSGFVNDKQMNNYYTPQEKQRRDLWLEETGQKEEN